MLRLVFGVLGLLVVVLIVGGLARKQLQALVPAAPGALPATQEGLAPTRAPQRPQQVGQDVGREVQRALEQGAATRASEAGN